MEKTMDMATATGGSKVVLMLHGWPAYVEEGCQREPCATWSRALVFSGRKPEEWVFKNGDHKPIKDLSVLI
jgi:hypothetical protein